MTRLPSRGEIAGLVPREASGRPLVVDVHRPLVGSTWETAEYPEGSAF